MFVVDSIASQVVIRERVEVDAAQVDSTAGLISAPGPVADAWPGGVRGQGTVSFFFSKALLRVHPLSSLSATVTTSRGQTYSLPIASAGQQTGEATVCLPAVDPSWTECDQWTYNGTYGSVLLEFEVAADEDLDSLFVTGPGLSVAKKVGISDVVVSNDVEYLQLNCGYTYFGWGPYHSADCNCMIGRTGEVHGYISLRWEFEADLAEQLLVTATPDTLAFSPSTPVSSALTVQAAYIDGNPAPLANSTPITYTASSTAYGSLAKVSCNASGCATVERGAALTLSYRPSATYLIKYIADGVHGDGSPPATEGPRYDTPVTMTATAGGLSGSVDLLILGSAPCSRETCPPGVEGPEKFDPAAEVEVREVGQTLIWGSGQSLIVQPLPIPLPLPLPDTTFGYAGPQFLLTDPMSVDTFNVGAGSHLDYEICLKDGRWVMRMNGLFVPIVAEEFVSRLGSVKDGGVSYPLVDLRDLTEDYFRTLLANGSITRADSLRLLLDIERERIGPYARGFYFRVFNTPPSAPTYIDTTDVHWGPLYRELVRPLVQEIRNYATQSSTPRRVVYNSSAAVMAHERDHVTDVTRDLTGAMDKWFASADSLLNGPFPPSCAEEVVAFLRYIANRPSVGLRPTYFGYIARRGRAEPHVSMKSELEADVAARPLFEQIRERLTGTYIPNAIRDGLW